jgi:hypothetical protein
VLCQFSLASCFSSKLTNVEKLWLENMYGVDYMADSYGNFVSESKYFYTWTKVDKKVSIDINTSLNITESAIADYYQSYMNDVDIIVSLTPMKFRIIPYSDDSTGMKQIVLFAKINFCYKGQCDRKNMYYHIFSDTGEGFEFPNSRPYILFLKKDENGGYYQLDSWAKLLDTKKTHQIIQKIFFSKRQVNK